MRIVNDTNEWLFYSGEPTTGSGRIEPHHPADIPLRPGQYNFVIFPDSQGHIFNVKDVRPDSTVTVSVRVT